MSEQTLAAADIGRLETLHGNLLDLCLRLEEAAGDPGVAGELRALADAIPPLLKAVHDLEERLLFPDFDRHAGSCFGAMLTEQLKAEHRYDRFAAQELSQTLNALVEQRCPLPLATVTAMMRGFAETLRRHLANHPVLFIECVNDDPELLALSVARKARLPEFDSVFIDADAELEGRYGHRVPVLRDAGGRELDWPFDAADVAKWRTHEG